ncbi:MAG: 3'(2'),5'-bisphosphate nucleotidase CysQ [Myxococcota bacterium]
MSQFPERYTKELEVACDLARQAGDVIRRHYADADGVEIDYKQGDKSNPVTNADTDANALIVAGLSAAFPDDAILAEESADPESRVSARRLWCVDPLDGTAEFIKRNGEFVVMIGLAIDGEARAGVVYQPTEDELFWGADSVAMMESANGQEVLCPSVEGDPSRARLTISRSHRSSTVDRVARALGSTVEVPCGSVGLKASRVARGLAEVYVSTSTRTREWDACAPEAILRAAGGLFTDGAGDPLRYNKPVTNTPRGMLATNGPLHMRCSTIVRSILADKGML